MPLGFYARAVGRSLAPVEITNKYAALESESSNENSEIQDLMGQHEEEELSIFIEAQRAFEEQAAQESELFEPENATSGGCGFGFWRCRARCMVPTLTF